MIVVSPIRFQPGRKDTLPPTAWQGHLKLKWRSGSDDRRFRRTEPGHGWDGWESGLYKMKRADPVSAKLVRDRRTLIIPQHVELDDLFILELLQQIQHGAGIANVDAVDALQHISRLDSDFFVETGRGDVVQAKPVDGSVHHMRRGSGLG